MVRHGADRSLTKLLVVGFFSLGAAVLSSQLGDSLAEVSGNSDTFLGVGFQASGLIGGFVLIFLLLTRTLSAWERAEAERERAAREAEAEREERRLARQFTVALRCRGTPQVFSKGDTYEAEYRVTTPDHETRTAVGQTRWDESLLVIDIPEVNFHDKIGAKLRNDEGITWEVSDFLLREPIRNADTKQVAVSKWAMSNARATEPPKESGYVRAATRQVEDSGAADLREDLLGGSRRTVSRPSPLRVAAFDQRNSTTKPRSPGYGHGGTERRGSHHG